jgi:hypothetical protein
MHLAASTQAPLNPHLSPQGDLGPVLVPCARFACARRRDDVRGEVAHYSHSIVPGGLLVTS